MNMGEHFVVDGGAILTSGGGVKVKLGREVYKLSFIFLVAVK